MSKKIICNFSASSFRNAAKYVREYQKSLDRKCEQLCFELCKEGIQIARTHIGSSGFGRYIVLSSEITPEQAGCKAWIYMEDTQKIVSQWQTQEGVQTKEISPALMLCFGSGLKAQNPANVPNVGTGSYGEQGGEPGGWWYMDLEGIWHHSMGIEPKMPMYFAGKELRDKVVAIAREVFS